LHSQLYASLIYYKAPIPLLGSLPIYHHDLAPTARGRALQLDHARAKAEEFATAFDVRAASVDTLAGNLSGGNQQKVVLAREMSRSLRLLIASQPTRGLDVGSIEFVHRRIIEERDAGIPGLMVST